MPHHDWMYSASVKDIGFHACNCIGPQPGRTRCPCMSGPTAEELKIIELEEENRKLKKKLRLAGLDG